MKASLTLRTVRRRLEELLVQRFEGRRNLEPMVTMVTHSLIAKLATQTKVELAAEIIVKIGGVPPMGALLRILTEALHVFPSPAIRHLREGLACRFLDLTKGSVDK